MTLCSMLFILELCQKLHWITPEVSEAGSSPQCLKQKITFFPLFIPVKLFYCPGTFWASLFWSREIISKQIFLALGAARSSLNCRNICFSWMISPKAEDSFTGSKTHKTSYAAEVLHFHHRERRTRCSKTPCSQHNSVLAKGMLGHD